MVPKWDSYAKFTVNYSGGNNSSRNSSNYKTAATNLVIAATAVRVVTKATVTAILLAAVITA